jgi:hypothetical protein
MDPSSNDASSSSRALLVDALLEADGNAACADCRASGVPSSPSPSSSSSSS